MKYFYFQPQHGFNDVLTQLGESIMYCRKYKRVLLLDTFNGVYNINFSDYFDLTRLQKYYNIVCIYDMNIIKDMKYDENIAIFPNCIKLNDFYDIINGKIKIKYVEGSQFVDFDNNRFNIPSQDLPHDIIVYSQSGGGKGFDVFSRLTLAPRIIEHCKNKYIKIPKPYISIQVRHTDYMCDYKLLWNKYVKMHRKGVFYLATDNKKVLNYFKKKNINVFNFCNYPKNKFENLHYSDIVPEIKMCDLLSDILMVSMSKKIISNSKGLFIKLLRDCHDNKKIIKKMYQLEE
jgi:hypothetical protein